VPPGIATLADIAAGYLAHMEEAGKSAGTCASYQMELRAAMAELGEATSIADITPEKVQEFCDSKRVTKLRSGKKQESTEREQDPPRAAPRAAVGGCARGTCSAGSICGAATPKSDDTFGRMTCGTRSRSRCTEGRGTCSSFRRRSGIAASLARRCTPERATMPCGRPLVDDPRPGELNGK
jgi:hypothetical protein